MASSQSSVIHSAIDAAPIDADTRQTLRENLRSVPRGQEPMKTVLASVRASRGVCWTSRKRVRHDALALLKEGNTYTA